MASLRICGLPVTVIPGVSSAIAGPALAGVPLTHRELTQGFTVISGHAPPGDRASTLNWQALATANTTLVIMMGVATLQAITAELIKHGLDADTPAMTICRRGNAKSTLRTRHSGRHCRIDQGGGHQTARNHRHRWGSWL